MGKQTLKKRKFNGFKILSGGVAEAAHVVDDERVQLEAARASTAAALHDAAARSAKTGEQMGELSKLLADAKAAKTEGEKSELEKQADKLRDEIAALNEAQAAEGKTEAPAVTVAEKEQTAEEGAVRDSEAREIQKRVDEEAAARSRLADAERAEAEAPAEVKADSGIRPLEVLKADIVQLKEKLAEASALRQLAENQARNSAVQDAAAEKLAADANAAEAQSGDLQKRAIDHYRAEASALKGEAILGEARANINDSIAKLKTAFDGLDATTKSALAEAGIKEGAVNDVLKSLTERLLGEGGDRTTLENQLTDLTGKLGKTDQKIQDLLNEISRINESVTNVLEEEATLISTNLSRNYC